MFKLFYKLLILILLLGIGFQSVQAASVSEIKIITEQEELQQREKMEVKIELLDETGEIIAVDTTLLIRFSAGNALQHKIANEGLNVEQGKASFTYLAPDKLGNVDILAIDLASNLSTRSSLKIVDQYQDADWQQEYAQIFDIKGNVALQRAGERNWQTALNELKLYEGDSIRTWNDSWVTLRLFDDSEIILEPQTNIKIKTLKSLADDAQVKRSSFEILSGNILSEVQGYLNQGARFQIETESAAAGVRGTFFEYIASSNKDNELIVYEGKVNFYQPTTGFSIDVNAGEKVLLTSELMLPSVTKHQISKAERLGRIKVEQEKSLTNRDIQKKGEDKTEVEDDITTETIEKTETAEIDETKKSGSQQTNFSFGSEQINKETHLKFSLQPEINNLLGTGLSLGFDFAFYQNPEGEFSFGPNSEDTKFHNIFNWLEYDGQHTYLRYSFLEDITYGYGLLFANYSKNNSRGFQLGFNEITDYRFGGRILLPFDIVSLYPWQTENTASLYAGRLTNNFDVGFSFFERPFVAGVNYITDSNSKLEELDYEVPLTGVSVDLASELTNLYQPYIELATLNDFGYGAELGVRGQLTSRLTYQSGLRFISESFIPNYFGEDYELYKAASLTENNTQQLPNLTAENYPANRGFYGKLKADIGLANLSLGYEDYLKSNKSAPILTATLDAEVPRILIIPQFKGGFNYKQRQFNSYDEGKKSLLNQKTNFNWYLDYQLQPSLNLIVINKFIPSDEEIEFDRELKISLSF